MGISSNYTLYPDIEPYLTGQLAVSEKHTLYYEECGNPDGFPVIFLHGGPGSGCNRSQRRFFDPLFYRIILFDQRGCGRSIPLGCTEENQTNHLVEDIEQLKHHLGIHQWLVFGGSWGSTLALSYAIRYKNSVSGLILRGIFLSRTQELNWFLGEVRQFYPEPWEKLITYLPEHQRNNPLKAYADVIFSKDKALAAAYAIEWNRFEASIMTLLPNESISVDINPDIEIARARVQIHYIQNQCFLDENTLLDGASKLSSIPTTIVQGRYDMVCPPLTAWELHQKMPHARFIMVPDAGHSGMERGISSALIEATERFKQEK
jgi:proline iminopeptidase